MTWLLRLLPMWDYICPKCQKEVDKNSHKCVHCGEHYSIPLRVPPKVLKDPKALENYVHTKIFPKVSASQREYLTQFFTEIFSDGFESGNFNAWTTSIISGMTLSVTTDKPHHGTYGMKITGIDNAGEYGVYIKTLASAYSEIYMRAYVAIDSKPSTAGFYCMGLDLAAGASGGQGVCFPIFNPNTNKWGIGLLVAGTVTYYYESGTSTLDVNTFYCVEVYVKIHATNGAGKLWVNGAEKVNETNKDTDNLGNIQNPQVGIYYVWNAYGAAQTMWIDCVVVADAYIGVEGAAGLSIPVAMRYYRNMRQ